MRIDRAQLWVVPLTLRERFEISSGSRQDRLIVLLRLEAAGVEGWSECVAAEDPSDADETTETAWHLLTDFLLPAIVGEEFRGPAEILDPVAWVRGHRMAKAAIEMAAWDVQAKLEGTSLSRAIGGVQDSVSVGVSIGLQPSDEALLGKVEGYLAEGYARIKIKIKPGRDIEMLRAVRSRFPEAQLMADANSAYSRKDIDHLRGLDELGLMMIEQPLSWDDIAEHALLQEALDTPICLDESIRSVGDAELALRLGACGVINIKPGRVGGLGPARAIHDLCHARSVPVWCGGMLESGIGRAHNVALASLPGFTLPGDISASARYWQRDLVDPEFVLGDGGGMRVPEGLGIGVVPDVERIGERAVRSATFEG